MCCYWCFITSTLWFYLLFWNIFKCSRKGSYVAREIRFVWAEIFKIGSKCLLNCRVIQKSPKLRKNSDKLAISFRWHKLCANSFLPLFGAFLGWLSNKQAVEPKTEPEKWTYKIAICLILTCTWHCHCTLKLLEYEMLWMYTRADYYNKKLRFVSYGDKKFRIELRCN